jgi:ABC-2 type transport system ATP-binding protein
VLLTTHHLDEADALADRVVVLANGRIVADGRPAEIKARVAATRIRCRTAIPLAAIASLPGALRPIREGAETILLTTSAAATLRELLAVDPALSDLTVSAATLEDAIAAFASKPLKAAA